MKIKPASLASLASLMALLAAALAPSLAGFWAKHPEVATWAITVIGALGHFLPQVATRKEDPK